MREEGNGCVWLVLEQTMKTIREIHHHQNTIKAIDLTGWAMRGTSMSEFSCLHFTPIAYCPCGSCKGGKTIMYLFVDSDFAMSGKGYKVPCKGSSWAAAQKKTIWSMVCSQECISSEAGISGNQTEMVKACNTVPPAFFVYLLPKCWKRIMQIKPNQWR